MVILNIQKGFQVKVGCSIFQEECVNCFQISNVEKWKPSLKQYPHFQYYIMYFRTKTVLLFFIIWSQLCYMANHFVQYMELWMISLNRLNFFALLKSCMLILKIQYNVYRWIQRAKWWSEFSRPLLGPVCTKLVLLGWLQTPYVTYNIWCIILFVTSKSIVRQIKTGPTSSWIKLNSAL